MAFYKEKIQKQLKKTLESFRNGQTRSLKAHFIHKQSKKRRIFRPQNGFHQQSCHSEPQPSTHILNFYNILNVNTLALKDEDHCESLIQSSFYYKTIRKIEVKQNYIVLFLNDSGFPHQPVQETLCTFQSDPNDRVREIGRNLQGLAKKLDVGSISKESGICLTSETYEMLDSLGTVPFICKIFSQKLVLSKSFLDLKEYPSEEFIIQSLKCKFPLLEMITSKNYFQILQKQIDFYSSLIDVLQGGIPFASFLETAHFSFMDTITSKTNVEYLCQMSLSMPIPLVELIKVQKIVDVSQNYNQTSRVLFGDKLKAYQSKIRTKEHKALSNLIALPSNYLPEQSNSVASYVELRKERLEDERKSEGEDFEKNSLTLSHN